MSRSRRQLQLSEDEDGLESWPSTSRDAAANRTRAYAKKSTSRPPYPSSSRGRTTSRRSQSQPHSTLVRSNSRPQESTIYCHRRSSSLDSSLSLDDSENQPPLPRTTRSSTTKKRPPTRNRKQAEPKQLYVRNDLRFLKNLRKMQDRQEFQIPKLPFGRVVREILQNRSSSVTKITRQALEGLQDATEQFLIQVMTDAYMMTLHRNRVTLEVRDIEILRYLRLIN